MQRDPSDPPQTRAPQPETFFDAGKSQAVRAAEQLRSSATAKVQQFRSAAGETAGQFRNAAEDHAGSLRDAASTQADQFREAAETQWSQARTSARDWQADLEAYVRANPTKSILATFGLGLMLGLFLRK